MQGKMILTQSEITGQEATCLQELFQKGFENAACGMANMLGQELSISCPVVMKFSISQLKQIVGDPETEVVGIYLHSEGDLKVQMMLVMPYHKALELVDLLMGVDLGVTRELGSIERSALGEIGNITATFFLNSIAASANLTIRPTPPAVVVDMLGAVLGIIFATTGETLDEALLLKVALRNGDRDLDVSFWAIPEAQVLNYVQPAKGIL